MASIHIANFSGRYDEWYTFHDTFNSLVHLFHYLKSSLRGEAAQLLQGIEISEENYEDAWIMLKDRFHNEIIIIQKHIRALFDMPVCNRDSSVSLRDIYDHTNSIFEH